MFDGKVVCVVGPLTVPDLEPDVDIVCHTNLHWIKHKWRCDAIFSGGGDPKDIYHFWPKYGFRGAKDVIHNSAAGAAGVWIDCCKQKTAHRLKSRYIGYRNPVMPTPKLPKWATTDWVYAFRKRYGFLPTTGLLAIEFWRNTKCAAIVTAGMDNHGNSQEKLLAAHDARKHIQALQDLYEDPRVTFNDELLKSIGR